MSYPKKFISATQEMATLYKCVPSPYFRKTVFVEDKIKKATFTVCGLGFYRFWLNAKELTKGFLSPYISNPDDVLDYDEYDITDSLKVGKNVLAFQLGNGMQNAFGGYVWDFDKAAFRSAPKMAGCLKIEFSDGKIVEYETDESFVWAPSPLVKDDLRIGEMYDANLEIVGWNEVDFDDSAWLPAILAETPKGEAVLCHASPIKEAKQLNPVSICFSEWEPARSKTHHYGYIYDFGLNTSGIIKLKIKGTKGQKIVFTFGEILKDDKFFTDNIAFIDKRWTEFPDYVQQDIYICRGEGVEEYEPSFTYHGFRYVFVEGITKEQATEDLLTYKVMYTELAERGNFHCSCEKLNRLQAMTRNATLSNFWHFPTDCPHREKNGWTADAALSVEHTLLNLDAYNNYYEWMRHIRSALDERGALPGIVPTSGWGFHWGNGPAWDQVIVEIPYMTYRYTGDTKIVTENIDAILTYVRYLSTRKNEKGLLAIGLGDWCAPENTATKSPLVFTDSVTTFTICKKAAFMARLCGQLEDAEYCETFASELRAAIRKELIDLETCVAVGECQTSQAMAIYYDILDEKEKDKAYTVLLSYIERDNYRLTTGVLGVRVIFHVLAEFGDMDLAYKMMVEPTGPSYGEWLEKGYTALAEDMHPDSYKITSKNHHFFGDISAFFIKDICGIGYNPNLDDLDYVEIKPHFVTGLENASAFHKMPKGNISVKWQKFEGYILLETGVPQNMKFAICLPKGYEKLGEEQIGDKTVTKIFRV